MAAIRTMCGWCGTCYVGVVDQCTQCGGATSHLGVAALGAEPPPAPRLVPDIYRRRVLRQNPVIFFAAVVFAVAAGFGIAFVVTGIVRGDSDEVGVGIAFLVLPASIAGNVLAIASKRARFLLRCYRDGAAVPGMLDKVHPADDTNEGRETWKISYTFHPPDGPIKGEMRVIGRAGLGLLPGTRVWVVYLKNDPRKNALYPPFPF